MKKRILSILLILLTTGSLHAQEILSRVIVANQGNFMQGNATLTEFIPDNGMAVDGVFFNENGFQLGDIAQNVAIFDGKMYVVVNNSNVIRVLNPETFRQRFEIPIAGGASPREIIRLNAHYAYVTNLFDNSVSLIDLQNNEELMPRISVGENPDKAFFHNGLAYISNNGFGADSTVFVIDPKLSEGTTGNIATHEIIDTLFVSRGPAEMLVDDQERLWIVSTGFAGEFDSDFNIIPGTGEPGGVHIFDINTREEIASIEIESAGSDIAYDPNAGKVYINSGGVRVIDCSTFQLDPDILIEGNFFAMNFSANEAQPRFYLADAKDFSVNGEVFIHDTQGSLVTSFPTGIIPGDILFIYDSTVTTNEGLASETPGRIRLNQNYPNPFNPSTVISFELPAAANVELKVFDITGREVATLVNEIRTAGMHQVQFDASNLASGMYLYRLKSNNNVLTRKLTLLK
ncbi:MAG: T9SS type A sorting domain-containing protein [Balneolaceae bacterium]